MNLKQLKCILDNLFIDLHCPNEDVLKRLAFYNMTKRDREFILRKLYDDYNLPTKVSTTYSGVYSSDKFDPDVEHAIYEKYINGFDEYLKKQEKTIEQIIKNNQTAVRIFRHIIALETPYSDILYLTYYRKYDIETITNILYISRPTYFRLKKKALIKLLEKINRDGELGMYVK